MFEFYKGSSVNRSLISVARFEDVCWRDTVATGQGLCRIISALRISQERHHDNGKTERSNRRVGFLQLFYRSVFRKGSGERFLMCFCDNRWRRSLMSSNGPV